ncbi:ADL147W-Ap [Eremothecium gossypii ATCC 10895]|uniref:ADL147W-Ap n=1 Tax=Eremothecium gossypii (strain ATCC 10895 / CBS 109.51 / FGSC 9923 / NRRL Y-1056) TaxID=284811 RepID=D8FGB9_EREGS|nr:ADL147W-Ap [Eremothecium gossypii ATCC 10895]ADJ41762.1 ADL147W-Ap [Eremothecium gossypii ATCC 10895]AEY96071.1 FADL147W-Ap [Eremothecium gossypii FDAG1]
MIFRLWAPRTDRSENDAEFQRPDRSVPAPAPPSDTHVNFGDLGQAVPIATWHIGGRNRFANDEQYRKMVDERSALLFSSIM